VIKFIPSPLVAGFIGGIGALIISNQVPVALGIAKQSEGSLIAMLLASDAPIATLMGMANPASLALASLTVAIAMTLGKKYPRSPAMMISVAAATLLQAGLNFPGVEMIGPLTASLPAPSLPQLPSLNDLGGIALYSGLFYGLASMESLLSAVGLDKLSNAKKPHNANQELIGQGIGNIACSFFRRSAGHFCHC